MLHGNLLSLLSLLLTFPPSLMTFRLLFRAWNAAKEILCENFYLTESHPFHCHKVAFSRSFFCVCVWIHASSRERCRQTTAEGFCEPEKKFASRLCESARLNLSSGLKSVEEEYMKLSRARGGWMTWKYGEKSPQLFDKLTSVNEKRNEDIFEHKRIGFSMPSDFKLQKRNVNWMWSQSRTKLSK